MSSTDALRSEYEDLRDRLKTLIDAEDDGSKLAALSREYRQVLTELDRMKPPATGSKVDEIAARRAARQSDSAAAPPAGRRSQSRRSGAVH